MLTDVKRDPVFRWHGYTLHGISQAFSLEWILGSFQLAP